MHYHCYNRAILVKEFAHCGMSDFFTGQPNEKTNFGILQNGAFQCLAKFRMALKYKKF